MIYEFKTSRGIDMVARLVLIGARYGLEGCLSAEQSMIEFYTKLSNTKHNLWLTEHYELKCDLYFISRYNLNTFLFGYFDKAPTSQGLCLDGSAHQYDLSELECKEVALKLFMQLAEKSKCDRNT